MRDAPGVSLDREVKEVQRKKVRFAFEERHLSVTQVSYILTSGDFLRRLVGGSE
jgi:hypothetical protein